MKQEIEKLALNIKDSIRNFTTGEISLEEAQSLYNSLNSDFINLKSSRPRVDKLKQLDGLCYYHNIKNYALYTGIYKIESRNLSLTAYYGESHFTDKITPIVRKLKDNYTTGETVTITPEDDRRLKNSLHLFFLKNLRDEPFVIVSLSSSAFFKIERFKFFGNFIHSLFPFSEKILYNCTDVYKSMDNYINDNVDENTHIMAYLYYFPALDKIFDHMGLNYLLNATSKIEKKLKTNWAKNNPIFSLSMKEYVILEKVEASMEDIPEPKLEFYYRSIPLPCNYTNQRLSSKNDFLLLSSKLFSLSAEQR